MVPADIALCKHAIQHSQAKLQCNFSRTDRGCAAMQPVTAVDAAARASARNWTVPLLNKLLLTLQSLNYIHLGFFANSAKFPLSFCLNFAHFRSETSLNLSMRSPPYCLQVCTSGQNQGMTHSCQHTAPIQNSSITLTRKKLLARKRPCRVTGRICMPA